MYLVVLAAALGTAWAAPGLGDRILEPLEGWAARLAERKFLSICLLAGAVVLIRISLLRVLPIPAPEVHDEFSYPLAADTFAHGRLANPPHPMWIYFDTFHVNQHPAYVSIYPPAQGAILALGQILGHPWIGILLSMSAMCAAVLWMLQGWLPARWALLGGILVLLRFGIFSYWMNSYWGGALPAIGGALAVGALPRILHFWRARDAVLLGIGTAILANSRAFEGFIFLIPVAIVLAMRMLGARSPSFRVTLPRVVAPLSVILILCGSFILYYNKRTTGSPFSFPYTLNVQDHFAIPLFAWQKTRQPLHFLNPQFDAYYNAWWKSQAWLKGRPDNPKHVGLALVSNGRDLAGFYLWPELCVPLIALPWFLRDRRVRFLIWQWITCFVGFLLVAWFQPHYAAPLTATTFALVTQGIRHVRLWRFRGRPIGIGVSRAVVLCAFLFAPFHTYDVDVLHAVANREKIATQLDSMPGDHLVIVRYTTWHNTLQEWVYNRADIDDAKIVWAREIPGVSMQPLLDYFRGRDVWLVEPDRAVPRLLPYSPQNVSGAPRGTPDAAH